MLSLKKLLSNHFIVLRKVVISSMTIFLLLFGVMPVKVNKVYADENVKINPFIWLMSYFGINIYTDAIQINEAFDTAIRLAYNTYLASLQPQQQVSIDDIIGSIEWTPSQPNVLRITGTVFNALKGFSNWVSSRSVNDEEIILEQFETLSGNYLLLDSYVPAFELINDLYFSYDNSGNNVNQDVRVVTLMNGSKGYICFVSESKFSILYQRLDQIGTSSGNYTGSSSYILNNDTFYFYLYGVSDSSISSLNSLINVFEDNRLNTSNKNANVNKELAIEYTFGVSSGGNEAVLNDIFALPEQAVLDDLIGAADPNQDVVIDLTDSDLPYTTAATLEDILSAINNLVDSYVQDNSYAETIGKVIAQGIAIDDELVDITYPEALTWEVPDLISIPAVYPIIYPDCPDLSACLISGVQEVSNTMNGIINAHPDTGNYVTAALYMGLVLLILGSTVL